MRACCGRQCDKPYEKERSNTGIYTHTHMHSVCLSWQFYNVVNTSCHNQKRCQQNGCTMSLVIWRHISTSELWPNNVPCTVLQLQHCSLRTYVRYDHILLCWLVSYRNNITNSIYHKQTHTVANWSYYVLLRPAPHIQESHTANWTRRCCYTTVMRLTHSLTTTLHKHALSAAQRLTVANAYPHTHTSSLSLTRTLCPDVCRTHKHKHLRSYVTTG